MAQLPEGEKAPQPAASTSDFSTILPFLNLPNFRSSRLLSATAPKQEESSPSKTQDQPAQPAQQSELLPPFLRGLPLLGLNLNGLLPQPNGQEPAKSAKPEPPHQ